MSEKIFSEAVASNSVTNIESNYTVSSNLLNNIKHTAVGMMFEKLNRAKYAGGLSSNIATQFAVRCQTTSRLLKLSTFLLLFTVLFTSCKDNSNDNPNTACHSFVTNSTGSDYHIDALSSRNTQERYGYLLAEILYNVEDYIVKNDNDIDIDASFTLIASYLSNVINERLGETISPVVIKLEMRNLYNNLTHDNTLELNDFHEYLAPKTDLFRTKFEKIFYFSTLKDTTMLSRTFIDSIKSIENEIYFLENLPITEKDELFALTSQLKYGVQYTVCASKLKEEEQQHSGKIAEQLQAKRCCCGAGCYCNNAIKDYIVIGSLGGIGGGITGGWLGALVGATVTVLVYDYTRE